MCLCIDPPQRDLQKLTNKAALKLQYLDVACHCLSIISFQHQLHAAQSVHGLCEATVFLILDISLIVQMTPKAECVEVLVKHLLPIWVQHGDINISHLTKRQKVIKSPFCFNSLTLIKLEKLGPCQHNI